MSVDVPTVWVVLALVIAMIAFVFSALVWLGTRAGDRDGDARAEVRLRWAGRPDGRELEAVVTVTNPAVTAAMVSARANPASALALMVRAPRTVHVPLRERSRLRDTTMLLGAAAAGRPARWIVPLGIQRARAAVRVEIRLDQDRRARLLRYVLAVPAAPSGMTRPLGVRDPQEA